MLKFFIICIAFLSVCNILVLGSSSSSLVDSIFKMNAQIQDDINSQIDSDLSSASTGSGTSSSISSLSSSSGSGSGSTSSSSSSSSSSSGSVSTSTVSGKDSDGNSYTRVTEDRSDGKNIYRTEKTTYKNGGKTTTKKSTIKI